MSQPIVIELGYIPPAEVRGNTRAHWTKRWNITKRMKESAYWHIEEHYADWLPYFEIVDKVKITFTFEHWRKIDLDNLAIGMKAFVDGALLMMPFDDDPDHVVYGAHTFTKCKKGESKTIVTIEELA